jgi:hypothetical protein
MAAHEAEATHTSHEAARTHESSSSLDREATQEKKGDDGVEPIRTISRVPGNPNYYEKDGLRTYGDGMEHDEHLPVCCAGCLEPKITKLTTSR